MEGGSGLGAAGAGGLAVVGVGVTERPRRAAASFRSPRPRGLPSRDLLRLRSVVGARDRGRGALLRSDSVMVDYLVVQLLVYF